MNYVLLLAGLQNTLMGIVNQKWGFSFKSLTGFPFLLMVTVYECREIEKSHGKINSGIAALTNQQNTSMVIEIKLMCFQF